MGEQRKRAMPEPSAPSAPTPVWSQMDAPAAANIKRDAKSEYLMTKFGLDQESVTGLAASIGQHPPAKRKEYYVDLALHLESSKRPSGTVMRLLEKIQNGLP